MKEVSRLKNISSIFSRSTLKKLASDPDAISGLYKLAHKAGLSGSNALNSYNLYELYELAYSELSVLYRNEYIYKNVIAEKIIKGKYRLSPRCYYASEFRVHDSIADVVIANGTTAAYEIKTELDSLDRLDYQISNYSKVFDKIYVVIPDSKYKAWSHKIPDFSGIITLTKNHTLSIKRDAKTDIDRINLNSIFYCMRREEIISSIKDNFGEIPNVKPVHLKDACKELFLTLSKNMAHETFLKALKRRSLSDGVREILKNTPPSLTSAVLSANFSKREVSSLVRIFKAA
ncbi:MAG: sce7726 family protein [Cellvibrio sp.]